MMFQYAALLSLARKNQAIVTIPDDTFLRRAFNISALLVRRPIQQKLINDLRTNKRLYPQCCKYYRETERLFVDKSNQRLLLLGYFQSFKYFHPQHESLIKREFEFLPEIRIRAETYLFEAKRLTEKVSGRKVTESKRLDRMTANSNGIVRSLTFIGVHVRHGIDVVWNERNIKHGHKVATKRYLNRAMTHFRAKFKPVVFVICSDDPNWTRKHIEIDNDEVLLVNSGFREVDLAVLTLCNHTITTIGTFSWWAAYLAGGQTIYYKDWPRKRSKMEQMFSRDDYFPPAWIGMD